MGLSQTLKSISINPNSIYGGDQATATVQLTSAAPLGGMNLNLTSNAAFATVPATVTVPENQTSATFTVSTTALARTATATIGASDGTTTKSYPLSVKGIIVSSLSFSPATVIGTEDGTATLTLNHVAFGDGVTVNLSSDQPFVTPPDTVTVPAGQKSVTFSVDTDAVGANGSAHVTATFGPDSVTARLGVLSPPVDHVTVTPDPLTGGKTAVGTVTLVRSAPASAGVPVHLYTDSWFAKVPSTVTVPPNGTTASFVVSTSVIGHDAFANVIAQSSSITATYQFTVLGSKLPSLQVSPNTVTDGGYVIGTLALATVAPAGGETIALSSDSAIARPPATVSLAAGAATVKFLISTKVTNVLQNVNISANINGKIITSPLTITPTPYAMSAWPKLSQNNQGTGLGSTPHENGNVKWSFGVNSPINSSPTMGVDGTIYMGSLGQLNAINPNGTLQWALPLSVDDIETAPTVAADGTIYVGCDDGFLYAVNPNGTLKWSFQTGGPVHSSVCIGDDGTLYFGSDDNNLYAVNPNGTQQWVYSTGGPIRSSLVMGPAGSLYIGSTDGYLYVVAKDGTLRWLFKTNGPITTSAAIAPDGTTYIGSSDSTGVNPQGRLFAITSAGSQKWVLNMPDFTLPQSSPTIAKDGTIYFGVGSADHGISQVYAVGSTGALHWTFTTDGLPTSTPALGADGTIYIGTGGSAYAINADGTKKWSLLGNSTGGFGASPAIGGDGTVYFAGLDQFLYAVGQ
ncbi:MAG TPA: PQQ-binding-like beta-propeller repeat protein [Fimbriimonas sp.]|nr:PQQ-binding-like beta-propeller repeat protein [Fimbriimonas sp.]